MSGLLDKIKTGKQALPRRVVLYGVQGIGKSTWASQAPSPVFVPFEDGLADIDCARLPLVETYNGALEAVNELIKEPHDYRTVVIDSLGWFEPLMDQMAVDEWNKRVDSGRAQGAKADAIEDIKFGKGRLIQVPWWRRLLAGLDMLRRERGMHTILLGHARSRSICPPDGPPYDRYGIRIARPAEELVYDWADDVLFAHYPRSVSAHDAGWDRTHYEVRESDTRQLITTDNTMCFAKNKCGLEQHIPMSWAKYAEGWQEGGGE